MDGDVTIRVSHSTVNYKDGLAITGKAPVGAPVSHDSRHRSRRHRRVIEPSGLQAGRQRGAERMGSRRNSFGGYSEKARVKGDWLVPLPQGMRAD